MLENESPAKSNPPPAKSSEADLIRAYGREEGWQAAIQFILLLALHSKPESEPEMNFNEQ